MMISKKRADVFLGIASFVSGIVAFFGLLFNIVSNYVIAVAFFFIAFSLLYFGKSNKSNH